MLIGGEKMFYGRELQKKSLLTMIDKNEQMISLIYGRRRIGKSELIKQALRETDVKSIYYECKQTTERNNVDSIAEIIADAFDFPKPRAEPRVRLKLARRIRPFGVCFCQAKMCSSA